MRESPSCVVSLRRFAIWRAAVGAVAALALGVLASWATAAVAAAPARGPVLALALALAVVTVAVAASLMRGVEPGVLACRDGLASFTPERSQSPRIASAELAVAIDIGSFLLLTLSTSRGGGRRSRRWLPVQRRGLERDWHALRCAVYAPPPVIAGAAMEAPS